MIHIGKCSLLIGLLVDTVTAAETLPIGVNAVITLLIPANTFLSSLDLQMFLFFLSVPPVFFSTSPPLSQTTYTVHHAA